MRSASLSFRNGKTLARNLTDLVPAKLFLMQISHYQFIHKHHACLHLLIKTRSCRIPFNLKGMNSFQYMLFNRYLSRRNLWYPEKYYFVSYDHFRRYLFKMDTKKAALKYKVLYNHTNAFLENF